MNKTKVLDQYLSIKERYIGMKKEEYFDFIMGAIAVLRLIKNENTEEENSLLIDILLKRKNKMKKEMINIPIYRAKKIDSDEYVEGLLTKCCDSYYIEGNGDCDEIEGDCDEIDPTTLAINFSDMKDSNDKRIFASLSESGKGGDILEGFRDGKWTFNVMFNKERSVFMTRIDKFLPTELDERLKIIGIKK